MVPAARLVLLPSGSRAAPLEPLPALVAAWQLARDYFRALRH